MAFVVRRATNERGTRPLRAAAALMGVAVSATSMPVVAHAQALASQGTKPEAAKPSPSNEQRPAADDVPQLEWIENPFSPRTSSMFVGATGSTSSDSPGPAARGGLILGGAPLQRMTVHGFIGRDEAGHISPEITGHYQFLGDVEAGYAVGALARYKTEGFTEAGGEAELGLTAGWVQRRVHLDLNTIIGFGLEEGEGGELGGEEGEEGELDGEVRLRFGVDAASFLRLGAAGQIRSRFEGERTLAGGRSWDVQGGPTLWAWFERFAFCLSGGPTTLRVERGVAAYGLLTFAAVAQL